MTFPARDTANTEDPLHSGVPHPTALFDGPDQIHSPLSEEEEEEVHARQVSSRNTLPWWKRPSPYWIIFGIFFSSIGFSALLAPKVAMYTSLACCVHRPEYVMDDYSSLSFAFSSTNSLVQAADVPIPYFGSSIIAVNTLSASASLPNSTYTFYAEIDPDPEQKCASDPVVQAVVAKLNAVFTTSTGILSCLTAGWWGSLSDRYGRRIVLFVSVFGLFVTEFTHVVTIWCGCVTWRVLVPIGWFLDRWPVWNGVGAAHAYLADTTDPPTRSRYFSFSLGLMFTGVAVGPVVGGLLIHATGTTSSVFYFATILHGAYALLVPLIFPESLTRARARGARLRWGQKKANQASKGRVIDVLKNITGFFNPLAVLLPVESLDVNPLKQQRKDWNLFFLAIAYALTTSILGSISYKFQYAAAQFGWTPETTSYYVSFIGLTRAIFLAAILPAAPVQLPSTPDEPLRGLTGTSPSRGETNTSERPRVSVGLNTIAFLSLAVASTGALFALASTVHSFSAGFTPAAQALALDIYTNRHFRNRWEVGKLFGALSVLQALGSQIISPALYGFVYFNTVATFPQAIMIVSMCTSFLALVSLLFVRIPSEPGCVAPGEEDDQGGQDVMTPEILLATEH